MRESAEVLAEQIRQCSNDEGLCPSCCDALDVLRARLADLRVEADTFRDAAKWHSSKRAEAEARLAELEADLKAEMDNQVGLIQKCDRYKDALETKRDEAVKEMRTASGEGYTYWQGAYDTCVEILAALDPEQQL